LPNQFGGYYHNLGRYSSGSFAYGLPCGLVPVLVYGSWGFPSGVVSGSPSMRHVAPHAQAEHSRTNAERTANIDHGNVNSFDAAQQVNVNSDSALERIGIDCGDYARFAREDYNSLIVCELRWDWLRLRWHIAGHCDT